MALTNRGRKLKGLIVALIWVALIFGALYLIGMLTTPQKCMVDIEVMSEFCKQLRFP